MLSMLPAKIQVDSYVRYCTDPSISKIQADWDARTVRNVLKGDPFSNYIYMACNGVYRNIYSKDANICEDELLRQCGLHLRNRFPNGAILVPIPNSEATPVSNEFKTLEQARRIVYYAGPQYFAMSLLLWRKQQEKSHSGGRPRLYKEHIQNLVLNGSTDFGVVLYDDVVTTGSQLIAGKLKLQEAGHHILGMMTVLSVLVKDGQTHSDLFTWKAEERAYFA